MFLGFSGCVPFLVADDQDGIYIGNPALSWTYNQWRRFDTTSQTYANRTAPSNPLQSLSFCLAGHPRGVFADGQVFTFLNDQNSLAVYDVQTDTWSSTPVPDPHDFYVSGSFAADTPNGRIYWFNGYSTFLSMDAAIGMGSLVPFVPDYEERGNVGVNIIDGMAYLAGGFFTNYSKGIPNYYGDSSQLSTIIDLATDTNLEMSEVPTRTSVVGSVWDGESIRYFGVRLHGDGDGVFGLGIVDYYVQANEMYQHLYDIGTDTWQTVDSGYPPGCLPFSIVEQGGWLYGIFSCVNPDVRKMQLFRTAIAITTTTTTTVGTTTTTMPADDDTDDDTTDDDTADDDTADDDTADDDTADDDTADDDVGDDDTSDDPWAYDESGDSSGDGDGNGGCGC